MEAPRKIVPAWGRFPQVESSAPAFAEKLRRIAAEVESGNLVGVVVFSVDADETTRYHPFGEVPPIRMVELGEYIKERGLRYET